MNSKCTVKKPSPTYISNQNRTSTLTSSKVIQRFPSQRALDLFREIFNIGENFLIDMFVEKGYNKRLLKNW